MTKLQKFTFVAIVILFSNACSIFEGPDPQMISNLSEEYFISMSQELSVGENPLVIRIETINPPDCKNSELLHKITTTNEHLSIEINGIKPSISCLPNDQTISTESSVQLNVSNYNLNLDIEGIISNSGQLINDPETFQVTLFQSEGAVWKNQKLLKIPDNIFWGEVGLKQNNETLDIDQFLNELRSRYSEVKLKEGDYGIFKVGTLGNLIKTNTFSGSFVENFVFKYADIESLVSDIFNMKQQYPQLLIEGVTGTGKKL